ncbi:uncharacterized protein EAE97_000131 [Botrytis byssoidea]|uniref:Uncharacterized protein n=1 Tax=Botrytis byssoidea TaxID=139641 RepID=A0A9P5IUS8_9HELO|nr:uncharacterized protein EAE97_000131 [Botrytis byssoidea]KAF7954872.1 hypothetical protein EAE97_000131 [Botrytis byssoidea]
MSNHPSLPSLDFGEIDLTPPSLRRQSRPYTKPINHEFGSIPQLPSSFSDASSLLDSSSRTSDIAIKSISSRSQAKVHDIRHRLMEYYVDWKWEFFASLIVIACPFIIVATLYPNAGKPLPEWPFQISINTLLSIYGLVFKTCLTFIVASCIGQLQWFWFSSHRPLYDVVCYDGATRGPWGSIHLLCSEHIRNPLTGLGSVILIAAVAIDPLIQQVVMPYDCSIALPNRNATLPRTNQVDLFQIFEDEDMSLGLPIKSAIYTPENWMTWQCETGNCTFSDTYRSLAYCSSCEDISDELIFETTCYDKQTNINITSGTEYCAGVLGSVATTSLYVGKYPPDQEAPWAGFWINRTIDETSSSTGPMHNTLATSLIFSNLARRCQEIYIIVPRTIDPTKRESDLGGPWIYPNMTIASNPWRLQGYGAAVCSLQACIRTYKANINGTRLTEQLISSSAIDPWGFIPGLDDGFEASDNNWIGMIDTHCISERERGGLSKQGYNIDSSSQWLPFNRSHSPSPVEDDLVSSLSSHRCLYLMTDMTMNSFGFMSNVVGSSFNRDVLSLESFTGIMEGPGIEEGGKRHTQFSDVVGPRMMLDLYDSGYIEFENIEETFSNVSDITTAWIRTHGSNNYSDPAVGKVLNYATCLRVQWLWIAFPATLAVLSLVCLVAVIVVMDRQQVPIWKSSPLALIMRGSNREFWCKPTANAMEERSKEITAILIKGSDPQIQVVRKDFGLVNIGNGEGNNSSQTLNGDAQE